MGRLKPGGKFPSERNLAQDLNIDFKTANKAVSVLVAEGLLQRIPGKGTFVVDKINDTSCISVGIVGNSPEQSVFRAKYYAGIIEGVKKVIDEKGAVFSYQTRNDQNYPELFRNLEIVDGILIFNPDYALKDEIKELGQQGYPYIVIGGGFFFEKGINYVAVEEIESAAMAVSALLNKGYKKIGFIASELGQPTYTLRLEGYKSALEKSQVEVRDELIYFPESESYEVECKRLSRWLNQNDLDAVFLGALPIPLENIIAMLRKVKGKNIAVALYDDFVEIPVFDYSYLAIKQPLVEIGRTAVLKLLDLIAGKERNTVKVGLKAELLEDGEKLISSDKQKM